jgi:hypothetical protein
LWEKTTNGFTGQRLQPYDHAVQGEAGFDFKLCCASVGYFSLGMLCFLVMQHLEKKIFNDPPNQAAAEFNDQLLVSDTQAGYLKQKTCYEIESLFFILWDFC